MQRKELHKLKQQPRTIGGFSFKTLKKGHLPEPWKKLGGPRLKSSGMVEVDQNLVVVFITRDGESLDRKQFIGGLFQRVPAGLEPLYILHYHPSHKGIHAQFNCESTLNYTNRQLPQAKQFSLNTPGNLDPVDDALRLASIFCERMGIRIQPKGEDLLQ